MTRITAALTLLALSSATGCGSELATAGSSADAVVVIHTYEDGETRTEVHGLYVEADDTFTPIAVHHTHGWMETDSPLSDAPAIPAEAVEEALEQIHVANNRALQEFAYWYVDVPATSVLLTEAEERSIALEAAVMASLQNAPGTRDLRGAVDVEPGDGPMEAPIHDR